MKWPEQLQAQLQHVLSEAGLGSRGLTSRMDQYSSQVRSLTKPNKHPRISHPWRGSTGTARHQGGDVRHPVVTSGQVMVSDGHLLVSRVCMQSAWCQEEVSCAACSSRHEEGWSTNTVITTGVVIPHIQKYLVYCVFLFSKFIPCNEPFAGVLASSRNHNFRPCLKKYLFERNKYLLAITSIFEHYVHPRKTVDDMNTLL